MSDISLQRLQSNIKDLTRLRDVVSKLYGRDHWLYREFDHLLIHGSSEEMDEVRRALFPAFPGGQIEGFDTHGSPRLRQTVIGDTRTLAAI